MPYLFSKDLLDIKMVEMNWVILLMMEVTTSLTFFRKPKMRSLMPCREASVRASMSPLRLEDSVMISMTCSVCSLTDSASSSWDSVIMVGR